MIGKSEHVDAVTLDRLLDESVPDDERMLIESHLERCDRCRDRLTKQASNERWWRAASNYLGRQSDHQNSGDSVLRPLPSVEHDQVLKMLAPTDNPRMLGRIGSYEVTGIVGSGGMGIVLKALDASLNRYVAIKLLRPSLATSATARLRFAREGRAAASVVHENVIAIHGVAESSGLPYLVMPYVRGESLASRIARVGPLKLEEILRIGNQVAAGLAAAHAQGLIHRDVKPSNILIEAGVERLRLTDFGLARAADDVGLTKSGTLAGTPEYMSPEQAKGEVVDPRSDLFSLGSVLWALGTGRSPFVADSTYGVIRRIIEDEPHPIRTISPSLPDWFDSLVRQLMAKPVAERFQTAKQVASILEQCLAHVQNADAALPQELKRAGETSSKKNRVAWAVLLLSVIAAAGFGYKVASDDKQSGSAAKQETSIEIDRTSVVGTTDWQDGSDQSLQNLRVRLSRLRSDID